MNNEAKLSCGGVATLKTFSCETVNFLALKMILHAFLIVTTGVITTLAYKNGIYNNLHNN